ncbi:MAG: hypothetical protein OEV55_01355 [candidate division Zixibacteria bacterium]|nr:hypothetical protein [candidate division Zixibacteria bacterium]
MNQTYEKVLFGFIAHILKRIEDIKSYFGYIVAQKIIYFLQEAYGVKLPYNFYFYHFGPYDDSLDTHLRIMKNYGLIDIGVDPKGMGYDIEVKKDAENYIEYAKKFIEENKDEVESVLKHFGNYEPKDLELAATIHFVFKNNKQHYRGADLEKVIIEKVQNLKPKFSKTEIEKEYDHLAKINLLN